MSGALTLSGRTEFRCIPAGREFEMLVLAEVRAASKARGPSGRPVRVVLALDRSSSVMGPAMEAVRGAARRVRDLLGPTDALGLVSFGTDVDVLIPLRAPPGPEALSDVLGLIRPRGATNLHGGLEAALAQCRGQPAGSTRVILVSDGEATAGETRDSQMVALAAKARDEGHSISTVGVGEDYDEGLLAALSKAGGGQHYHVDRFEKLASTLGKEMERLRQRVATGLSLGLRLPRGAGLSVQGRRFAAQERERECKVRLDDAEEGRLQAVLGTMKLPARRAGELRVARLSLEACLLDGEGGAGPVEVAAQDLVVEVSEDPDRVERSRDPLMRRASMQLDAMEELTLILQQVRRGYVDTKTAVKNLDTKTRVLVRQGLSRAAHAYAAATREVASRGEAGARTVLKRTLVEAEEVERSAGVGRTLIE